MVIPESLEIIAFKHFENVLFENVKYIKNDIKSSNFNESYLDNVTFQGVKFNGSGITIYRTLKNKSQKSRNTASKPTPPSGKGKTVERTVRYNKQGRPYVRYRNKNRYLQ